MKFTEYVQKYVLAPVLPELPVLAVLLGCLLLLVVVCWLLFVRWLGTDKKSGRQVAMLVVTGIAFLVSLLLLGSFTGTTETVVGLFGLIISVALAISSTSFTSNMMAGLMLRAVRNFRMGDFVHVGEHFGRVAERGLFHVEIQTEDRDLATLPNMYLVSNPVRVVRASGTIISTSLSLGYDVPHSRVQTLLEDAARQAELEEPFVYILELGDFSITYRIAGFLPEVKQLLSARSRLRVCVLDALHAAGVEIVSPTFMNQRRITDDPVIPPTGERTRAQRTSPQKVATPEDIMFDKAEEAERIESERFQLATLEDEIKRLENELKEAEAPDTSRIEAEIENRRGQMQGLKQRLDAASEDGAG